MKKYYQETDYIHYSNTHEDTDILLHFVPPHAKVALSIAAAGDNTFSLLTTSIEKIDAYDSNINQIRLCKLKQIAIKHLTYHEFLIFIGVVEGDIMKLYHQISQFLPNDVKTYFDAHINLITQTTIIHLGRFEYYFQIFKKYILRFTHSKKVINHFMNQPDLSSQVAYYHKKFNNWRFRLLFHFYFSKKIMAKLGRDQHYFKYATTSLPKLLKQRILIGFTNTLNQHNPYLQYVIYNEYRVLPFYLQPENFAKIKEKIESINFIHGDLLSTLVKTQQYDFFNLSDIFEYCSTAVTKEYETALLKQANNKARLVFWNMMIPRTFDNSRLIPIDTTEQFKKDRAFFYQALHAFEVSDDD